jgi:hypothetical protein
MANSSNICAAMISDGSALRSPRVNRKQKPMLFLAFAKTTLGDAVADVRISDRLTDSAVCLVATEHDPDRQLERLLASAAKPILEVNPRHRLIVALAGGTALRGVPAARPVSHRAAPRLRLRPERSRDPGHATSKIDERAVPHLLNRSAMH